MLTAACACRTFWTTRVLCQRRLSTFHTQRHQHLQATHLLPQGQAARLMAITHRHTKGDQASLQQPSAECEHSFLPATSTALCLEMCCSTRSLFRSPNVSLSYYLQHFYYRQIWRPHASKSRSPLALQVYLLIMRNASRYCLW